MVVHIASAGLQLDTSVDLRRKRTRDLAEVVADHAQWATPDDRAIIWAIYREGLTAQQVAHLRGDSPRHLRAKVRRIVARLVSDRFRFVVRRCDAWPQVRRNVACACVLQGRSMRDASEFLHLSLHQVRREMGVIRALMDEETRPAPGSVRGIARTPAPSALAGTTRAASTPAHRRVGSHTAGRVGLIA